MANFQPGDRVKLYGTVGEWEPSKATSYVPVKIDGFDVYLVDSKHVHPSDEPKPWVVGDLAYTLTGFGTVQALVTMPSYGGGSEPSGRSASNYAVLWMRSYLTPGYDLFEVTELRRQA
jgi:hypothetical protein